MNKVLKKALRRPKRVSPSEKLRGLRWVLTQHGASQNSLAKLVSFFETDQITVGCIAYQTGLYGVHPHWQCYFQTAKNCRMKMKIEQILGHKRFHLEIAKGTQEANIRYLFAVDKQHQIGWIRFQKNVDPPYDYRPEKTDNLLRLHRKIQQNPECWQAKLVQKFTSDPCFRDILWIYEPEGNTGKTYFAKYLHYFYGAILTGGKGADMKHAITRWKQITGAYPVIILIDLARSDQILAQGYRTIEQMKNAIFFSGKYQSGMVASVMPPHFCVFANVAPNQTLMSPDRWTIYRLNSAADKLIPQKRFSG